MKRGLLISFCVSMLLCSCKDSGKQANMLSKTNNAAHSFGHDRAFLKDYVTLIELHADSSKVLVIPQFQGRVMTSSCNGDTGKSFGWVNYSLIASKKQQPHINAYGGEERLWLAPEGGQFSYFFKKGVPYDFEHWFTPKEFDTEPFETTTASDTSVLFKKDMELTNRAGTSFTIHIDRRIQLLNKGAIEAALGIPLGLQVQSVAYESENTLTNAGKGAWTKTTGAPAIWLLGMMQPTPQTTIVLPLRKSQGDTTPLVHDQYFGNIPPDRWKIVGDHAYLKADGKFRGKVGIPPQHTTNFIGSYDPVNRVLTLLKCTWPQGENEFVNSVWEEQRDPFSGDAFNAYNDGPLKDGTQLGPFYELESLSPAAFLAPGKSLTHYQITFHLRGPEDQLDTIARHTLGVGLSEIKKVF